MRRGLALILVLALVAVVRGLGGATAAGDHHFTAMALGFALVAALLVGWVFERVGLPRLTGYLLLGVACGPYGADLITKEMALDLKLLNGTAVALVSFIAGLEMNLRGLKGRVGRTVAFGGTTIACLLLGLLALFVALSPWLTFTRGLDVAQLLVVLLVFATVLTSFSPTVTIAVLTETRSRGPLSDLVMATVVLVDLFLVVFFTLGMTAARGLFATHAAGHVGAFATIAWEVPGSLLVGAAVGGLVALYNRFVGRAQGLVVFAICVLLSEVGERAGLSALLLSLTAGAFLKTVAPARGESIRHALEPVAVPVLVVFFSASGASLHLDSLARLWPLALILFAARVGFARAGTMLGAKLTRSTDLPERLAWLGFISQAGITLGLGAILAREFPTWGPEVQALVVAIVALNELLGPVAFQWALRRAGEVGQADAADEAEPLPQVQAG